MWAGCAGGQTVEGPKPGTNPYNPSHVESALITPTRPCLLRSHPSTKTSHLSSSVVVDQLVHGLGGEVLEETVA